MINALAPESINTPKKAMTLAPDLHQEFGMFNFGFVNKGVRSKVSEFRMALMIFKFLRKTIMRLKHSGACPRDKRKTSKDRQIVFRTDTDNDLPDSNLLTMHLAICRALDVPGMDKKSTTF